MFIVVEGVDGSGKTTLCRKLVESLLRRDLPAVYTCEPRGVEVGKKALRMISDGLCSNLESEALLMLAARSTHCDWMRKKIADGNIVICDRYDVSTAVYQNIHIGTIKYTQERFSMLDPDVYIFANESADVISKRISSRKKRDFFDTPDIDRINDLTLMYVKNFKWIVNYGTTVLNWGSNSEIAELVDVILGDI